MKEYSKPVIDIVSEAAEGVYAASGKPGCDSEWMNSTYQHYQGGWDKTVKEYYGCIGCPAYRDTGCALEVDQAYLDGATSYDTDNGKRMPEWEAKKIASDRMIDNTSGLPY